MQSSHPTFKIEIKSLLVLMWPILLTQIAQAGFGLIDTIMAGRLSAADLAAIAVGVGIWFPVMLLCSGILMATSPLIAAAVGASNYQPIRQIVQQGIWIAFFIGTLGMGVLWLAPFTFDLIGVPQALQQSAALFLYGAGVGLPAVTVYTVLRAYCEAINRPRIVTVISLAGLLLLIPLNAIFMYGWGAIAGWGGAGAGIANALLQWIMLIGLLIYIMSAQVHSIGLFQHWQAPQWDWIKRILTLGLPIGLGIFFEVSLFSSAGLVISPLGEQKLAAHQIAISITSQLFMIPLDLSYALTIRVGQHYGAQRWQVMRQVQKIGLMLATLFAGMTMVMLWLGRDFIIRVYTQDPAVTAITWGLLSYVVAYQLIDGWQVAATGCLRGMQDTRSPMWITLFSYWLVAFPIGFYLTRFTQVGPSGVWIGMISGLSIACLLLLVCLWRHKQPSISPSLSS